MKAILRLYQNVKPYWKSSLLALVTLTLVVMMDLAIPRLVQRIIDQGIGGQNMGVVIQTALLMFLFTVLSTALAIWNNVLSVQVGEATARDLREELFLKIQSFSYGNLDRLNTGLLMIRLSSDTTIFQRLVQVTLRIGTRAPLLMIGSLILMFNTDARLALSMMPILLVTGVIMVIFVTKMEPIFRSVQQRMDQLNNVLQENIAGARLVKAFVRQDHENERFGKVNLSLTERAVQVMRFMSSLSPALTVFVNIGMVVVIWAGGLQSIRGELTIGQIVAFTNYLLTTMGPLMFMVMFSNLLAAGAASAERILEVLDAEPDVPETENPLEIPLRRGWQVTFEDVSFHYDGSPDAPVLEGINLTAGPNETVAFLGATGSGKTTLVNLIARFYDPSSGRVLLNGVDLRRLRQDDLLGHIGITPQETVLFSGTVADNIRYGMPDAPVDAVVGAAKAAQAHDFIEKLPEGYQTHIEERGVNLSGGQKQRIAIARSIISRPAILILDDSTSSVDVETETNIQNGLKAWMQGDSNSPATIFVVAQRISTVLNADKIVVLEDGRIAAVGNHAELIQSSPIYQEIFASQLGAGLPAENGSADPAPAASQAVARPGGQN